MRSSLALGPRAAEMKGSFLMASLWSLARSDSLTSPHCPSLLPQGMR